MSLLLSVAQNLTTDARNPLNEASTASLSSLKIAWQLVVDAAELVFQAFVDTTAWLATRSVSELVMEIGLAA